MIPDSVQLLRMLGLLWIVHSRRPLTFAGVADMRDHMFALRFRHGLLPSCDSVFPSPVAGCPATSCFQQALPGSCSCAAGSSWSANAGQVFPTLAQVRVANSSDGEGGGTAGSPAFEGLGDVRAPVSLLCVLVQHVHATLNSFIGSAWQRPLLFSVRPPLKDPPTRVG